MQPSRTATIAAATLVGLGVFALWLMVLLTRDLVWGEGANVGDLSSLLMFVLGGFDRRAARTVVGSLDVGGCRVHRRDRDGRGGCAAVGQAPPSARHTRTAGHRGPQGQGR